MNSQDQTSDQSQEGHEFQPGHTITPDQAAADNTIPTLPTPVVAPANMSAPQAPANMPAPQVSAPPQPQPAAPVPSAAAPAETPASSLYHPVDEQPVADESMAPTPVDLQMQDNGREIAWTAAEFVEHKKTPSWFLAMAGVAAVVVAIVFFVTRDWFNTAIVAVATIIFGVSAARPPRMMHYSVSDHGVSVGRRGFPYENFRSFSIVAEEAATSIVLMPLKRFMPPISLYYDPADEEAIGDMLAAHLPYEQRDHELTERLMRRIRF
jgi:hypothetical protein